MGAKTENKDVIFETFAEYQEYYAATPSKKSPKKSKYYLIGEHLAERACTNALHLDRQDHTPGIS